MKLIKQLGTHRWALGFVRGGMDAVMNESNLSVDWVKMPKDRWYADPFILEVSDDEIQLLVEDYPYATRKGMISLLKIDRSTMEIKSRKTLLELPTHLSFPCILRENGHIYVYPESANSGRLDMYEYHPETETLTFYKTICDDVVWDSCITDLFGERMLFTAAHNDHYLDIYIWDKEVEKFLPWKQIKSETPNSRMGGQLFEYNGEIYYPAQDCSRNYGSAIDIKRVRMQGGVSIDAICKLQSPNKRYPLGLHTLNEYKGFVVIDVLGYRYPVLGPMIAKLVKLKKKIL